MFVKETLFLNTKPTRRLKTQSLFSIKIEELKDVIQGISESIHFNNATFQTALESPGNIRICGCLAKAAVSGLTHCEFQYWKHAPGHAMLQPLLFLPVELVAL